MKILQVNSVYNSGSTGKITYDIHNGLQELGIESVVCYGRGMKTTERNVYKICSEFYSHIEHFRANVTGLMYGGCEISTHRLIHVIKKEVPDVVHLQCINGYFVNIFKILEWLKENNIATVLTLHAEFMYTANCGHALDCEKWRNGCGKCPRAKKETQSYFKDATAKSWKKMKAAFDGFDNLLVVSVSPWLMERAIHSPMLEDKEHRVVYNGLDTRIFHRCDTERMRINLKIGKKTKVIFHATPGFSMDPSNIKGGFYIVELAKMLLKEEKDAVIVIAGGYDETISYPSNMIMLGKIVEQEKLAQLYSLADVTVLTSKKETFSMVTAESLCCGTPVVGFKAGSPELIAIPDYSSFGQYGNLEELYTNAIKFWNLDEISRVDLESQAHGLYSKQKMCEEYMVCYNKFFGDKNDRGV